MYRPSQVVLLTLLTLIFSTSLASAQTPQEHSVREVLQVMPKVEGTPLERARKALSPGVDLKILRIVDEENIGLVIRTSPAAGQPLYRGQSVLIYLGQAPSGHFGLSNEGQERESGSTRAPWAVYLILQTAILYLAYRIWRIR